ncbi:beta-glucoside-specific PTS transporter subunit IIABC [Clostridium sp.]|uniref:beta-glucoside-specific PTS transporter subunit IIABC n=1 Tax=Clostridium sp. TaxID=1506 RepID=UPI00261A43B5
MNYKELAKTIINLVGGKENISSLTHCATRLRFTLKDENKADTATIKATKGVIGAVNNGGQYQVIIGSEVANVYREVVEITNLEDNASSNKNEKDDRKLFAKLIDTISGIFTPVLPAITASGMLKAVLSLLLAFNLISKDSQSYQVINFMADAAFYFLPILLASSAAKKFKCNQYMAMMLGGILLHPNFIAMINGAKEAGSGISVLGLPIKLVNYGSSVIPIILAIWLMSYIEPIADKVSPKFIKFFSKPLITVFVTGIITLVVIGPLGFILSDKVALAIKTLESYAGWLVPTIIGAISPLLVMTGTHYGLMPIGISNRITMGYDAVLYPGILASNVAQGGATLAVAFKSKNSEIKQLASSTGITAVCGITEPALYGVNLRFRPALYASIIGGAVGGLFLGLLGVRNYSGGVPGALTLPSYIGGDTITNFIYAVIGTLISIVVSFVVCYIFYKDPVEESSEVDESPKVQKGNIITVKAPLIGEAVSLKSVNDPVFSDEIMGKGIAIIPTEGKVVSPIEGTVEMVFETKHAIALKDKNGVEMLIHIGLDTVKLGGRHFNAHVSQGDKVSVGTLLVDFDMDKIKEEGYDCITPIIITNVDEFGQIVTIDYKSVTQGEDIIKVIK